MSKYIEADKKENIKELVNISFGYKHKMLEYKKLGLDRDKQDYSTYILKEGPKILYKDF
jgi:hypothetical protein